MPIPDLCPCPCVSARRRVWPDGGGALGDSELPSEWESRRPLPLSAPGPEKGAKKGRPASVADAFEFQVTCLSRCFLMMVTDGKASPPMLPGNDSLIHPAIHSTFGEHPFYTGTGLGPAETNLRKTPRVLSNFLVQRRRPDVKRCDKCYDRDDYNKSPHVSRAHCVGTELQAAPASHCLTLRPPWEAGTIATLVSEIEKPRPNVVK